MPNPDQMRKAKGATPKPVSIHDKAMEDKPEDVTAIHVPQQPVVITPDTVMTPTDQFAGISPGVMTKDENYLENMPDRRGSNPQIDLNATPWGAKNLTPDAAGTLGLSGSDAGVSLPGIDKAIVPATIPTPTKSVGPVIAKSAPTTKEMIASVLKHTGPEGELSVPASKKEMKDFNFADLVKGAGGKLGDFLQRWGMGLQGSPTGQTQGDIQRAQEFEIKKQQAAAQVQAAQAALENKYQMERMNLQNQMNLANLPVEKKAELANSMAVLDAQFQNEMKLLPAKIAQERAVRGMAAGADPGAHFVGGG